MCEDTCVLLVSARICGDLTILNIVLSECRIVENETVLAVEILIDSVESLDVSALFLTDLGHNCEALGFDEDLTFFAFLGAHLLTVSIVSSEEPVTVKCGFHSILLHLVDLSLSLSCFVSLAQVLENTYVSRTCVCEESCNEYRLCNL